MPDTDEYPEHTKLQKIVHKSQTIGEFLEWLTNEKGYALAPYGITALLADYFEIDQDRLEEEKLDMIKFFREVNGSSTLDQRNQP